MRYADAVIKISQNFYYPYAREAARSTLFCGLIWGLYAAYGISSIELGMAIFISGQSCFAGFSVPPQPMILRWLAFVIVALMALLGGVMGYYHPLLQPIVVIACAAFTFYFFSGKAIRTLGLNAALMVMVFGAFPFHQEQAWVYAPQWGIAFLLYMLWNILVYRDLDSLRHPWKTLKTICALSEEPRTARLECSLVGVLSLSIAYLMSALLPPAYTHMHAYWIPMVCLLVIQTTTVETFKTIFQRILMNILGAMAALILFGGSWLGPMERMVLLGIFLYGCFFFSFSYRIKTFCVTVFILGVYHVIEHAQAILMLDRVLFTILACSIVAFFAGISLFIKNRIALLDK